MENFIRIPGSLHDIRINENGELRSFDESIPTPNTTINKKGYVCSWFKDLSGNNQTFRIHRVVGILFVEIPEKYGKFSINELQINHKDGDKNNNKKSNLEWATNDENMKHARETGLFSNEKPVLVMDRFGNIEKIKSLSETCNRFGITPANLSVHLLQKTAGCVVYKGYRFKYDNNREWCTVPIHPDVDNRFGIAYKVVGINTLTGEKWLFGSIPEAADVLKLNVNSIKTNYTRHGVYRTTDKLWTFFLDKSNNLKVKQKKVIAFNKQTGEELVFRTTRICARELKIPHLFLSTHLQGPYSGMLPWNGFYFRYENDKLLDIEYLIPNASPVGAKIGFLVYKENDKKPYLLTNLSDLCMHRGWNRQDLYHHRERVGTDVPFRGLLIIAIDDNFIIELRKTLEEYKF